MAVLGMPPIDPADLLDDSPTRRPDIQLILREAARSFFDGKISPSSGDDDYLLNRSIRVETLDTHVCPSIGRQTRPAGNGPQPWAWLRVHEATSRAEIAYEGLKQLAPGRVVLDRHRRAIPLEIPTGETGPKMLEAVRDYPPGHGRHPCCSHQNPPRHGSGGLTRTELSHSAFRRCGRPDLTMSQ
jgi:hypothetical protein